MQRTLFVVPILLLASSLEPAIAPPAPPVDPPAAASRVLPPVTREYQTAAVSVRRHDFAGALEALDAQSRRDDGAGRYARLVTGLYAHSLELPENAARLLGEEPVAPGPLEDWRLWVLADCRAATGDPAHALDALDRLLADWPDSPLWPRAVVRAVELARDAGSFEHAFALLDLGRGRALPAAMAEKLERLAFEIGTSRGRTEVADGAAVRLLVDYPLAASELGVTGRYAVSRLTLAQQLRRAESLLSRGMAADAEAMLAVTPAADRDLDWHLQMARVLTVTGRGEQSARLLVTLAPREPAAAARVAWARAQASLDQSEARRGGRSKMAATARERSLRLALAYLDEAARLGDREVAIKALHQLFAEHASRDHVDSAIAALRRLRAVAPEDPLGVAFLWQRGWREYRVRNYTGAIGFWSELVTDPVRERYPRGARYWSARAFEALGQPSRARELYAELAAADTTDFYRRHALARLGAPSSTAASVAAAALTPDPWPSDPRLVRARYLSDIGLDGLASTEMALVGDSAEPRARAALQGILLARQGFPRPSMDHLRIAFPALGTPLQASVPTSALELYYPLHYREAIERWAQVRDLPVPLLLGVIRQESAFDLSAISRSGARGLMQLMPGTAREVALKIGLPFQSERLHDPDYGLQLGTSYLAHVLGMFDGDVELALAGYNSGPYRLRRMWNDSRHREVDSFIEDLQLEEPKTYVRRILLLSDSYSRLYPELAAG